MVKNRCYNWYKMRCYNLYDYWTHNLTNFRSMLIVIQVFAMTVITCITYGCNYTHARYWLGNCNHMHAHNGRIPVTRPLRHSTNHSVRTEKTSISIPFILNGIWSWWQFSFRFSEPNGIPLDSKSKGKLSPQSYPIQFARNCKCSFLSVVAT